LFEKLQTVNGVANTPVPTTVVGSAGTPASCPNCGWAQLLTARLQPVTGQTVTAGEPYAEIEVPDGSVVGFHLAPCTSTAQCVFPGGVIPTAAFSPAAIGTLPSIPVANVANQPFNYSDNSGRNRIRDDKIGERVDFNNQKTGNWSFYYHFDDSNV